MKFMIVTGMSGAGKSTAMNVLEDMGYYVIDNIPPRLIPEFANICMQSQGRIEKVAIVADVRSMMIQADGTAVSAVIKSINDLIDSGSDVSVVYLDADDNVLVRRYKETRRAHPLDLGSKLDIADSVSTERKMLAPLREIADIYFDTSRSSPNEFKKKFRDYFSDNPDDIMTVKILSFGFKYGIPTEADFVFDVRFLPNPFYIPELKKLTGRDKEVRDYVMSFDESQKLEKTIFELADIFIPLCINEGRPSVTIAFGCTGGQHRSVTFAERLYEHMREKNIRARLTHRELG